MFKNNGFVARDYVFVVGERVVSERSFSHTFQAHVWAWLLAEKKSALTWDLMCLDGGIMTPVSNESNHDYDHVAA
ncbi:hypothetical protein BH09ACT10_BH09ACT10_16050 [soil metagenome]